MLALLALLGAAVAAPVAFLGGTVHPVSGPVIDDGVVVIENGRIVAVGPRASVPVPEGATTHDVAGKHLIPGLVDTHSHVGGGRLHEAIGPVQPAISAIDAIDPTHVSLARARAGGITTVNVMPGSGKLMGGQTAYLKLRQSNIVDDLLLCTSDDDDGFVAVPPPPGAAAEPARPLRREGVCGGMKMANGTNPQGKGGDPRSRMGAAFLQRTSFLKAQERRKTIEAREAAAASGKRRKRGAEPKPLKPDLEADAIVQLLRKERVVHFHTHRADDIVTILRLQEEFGFEVVLHHVSEAWKVADLLGEREAALSLIVLDSPGGKEEALEIRAENAPLLQEKGALIALHTDDPITDSRLFLRMAAQTVRAGMDPAAALASVTLNPARMLHLEDRVGSLEPGKDADLVVLSGPPLSTWTHIEQTWVEGALVFDRSRPADHRLAVGGDATASPTLEDAP